MALGSKISCESTLGQGSVFRFDIDLIKETIKSKVYIDIKPLYIPSRPDSLKKPNSEHGESGDEGI